MQNTDPGRKTARNDQLQPRLVLGGVVAILAAIGIFGYFFWFDPLDMRSATSEQPIPGIEQREAVNRPTDLQQFRNDHGPWLSTDESEELRRTIGVRNLVVFGDNGLIYSVKSAEFQTSPPWVSTTRPPQIRGVEVRGSVVEIETADDNRFTFNVTQPFVLNGNLSRVFVVDRERRFWSAQVADLTFVPAEAVADPSIPANPGLTISTGR